jgi:hypothetical protein
MERCGLVGLERGEPGRITPKVMHDRVGQSGWLPHFFIY